MNYVFVDIDGPLLPGKMHLYPQNNKITAGKLNSANPKFDSFAVRCFNLWAQYADAKIIFSTNWALSLEVPEDQLKAIMYSNGLVFTNRYHENVLTPKKFTSQRGSEIWWWLIDNAKDGDKFIAVDDDTSCGYIKDYIRPREMDKKYPGAKPDITGKWIEVDFTNGLTWENFKDGCEALDIDFDDINEQEFGIKKLTNEEKAEREKAFDLLSRCAF